ncbi:MAG: T9SS type A sorting domain-containing protein [Ignavibacteria bacterium]|nr:T9SS type A sorting domain-containing protein [Ignavibacteria bacterium]MDH7527094.1 T9SS type A sorting domain-containing protein [Ignavibacteria bacterium]
MKVKTLIIFITLNSLIFGQDLTTYPWPLSPTNQSKLISGTFCEYRSTSASGHYHNAVDIPAPAGTPVLAVLPGTVITAYSGDPTGYDNYIRVRSVIDGKNKDITYYHTNPVKSVGQTVNVGYVISTIAIDHVHLIEYYLGNTSVEVNPIRPDGGLTPLIDIWKPSIRSVRFFVDGTSTQLSPNYVGGKVDIIVHIQEANWSGSGSGTNNGSYAIGYKILSADTQTVVYNPPSNSLRYRYYIKPLNDYVNYNYYQPEATTSNHVYIITNGNGADDVHQTRRILNNYWDADLLPDGNYIVMVYTYDTRGNADTVYIPIYKTSVDLIPPSQTNLKAIVSDTTNKITLQWEENPTPDLKGHRIYFSFNNSSWTLRDNENIITAGMTSRTYDYTMNKAIYFKINPVDNSPNANVGIQSDVYGIRINSGRPKILIVDGFTRTSGSYKQPYNDFAFYYGSSFDSDFETASAKTVETGLIDLMKYDAVIWFTGDESIADETFNSNEQNIIKNYLRNGGKLFVTGSEIGYDLFENGSTSDRDFYTNYLRANYVTDNSGSLTVYGDSNSVFAGLNFNYGLVSYGSPYNEDYPDAIDTINGSQVLLRYANNKIAGIGYKGLVPQGTKVCNLVYIGFPFETIIGEQNRRNLMTAFLNYFGFTTSVEEIKIQEKDFHLFQNFPNPFNSRTKIRFYLKENANVTIQVYDLIGRLIETIENKNFTAGLHEIDWDASNLSSGIYYINLKSNADNKFIKAVLIK